MPPSEQPRVFISYARKDGTALAQRLQKDLNEKGFDAWLDTQRISGGRVWSTEIEDAVKSCRVVIALMSPGSSASEICRSEQLLALDLGIRVIPVLAAKTADRPIYLYAKQYRDFSNDADYIARLAELVADIRGDATATLPESYRKTRVTYLTAPPRVANYLERPEALHALRDALFAEDHRQPIALTALAGMGGIGKTVLAKALTDDQVVQRAFPDGIVWITAGKERKRDFIAEMREVAKALGDDLNRVDSDLAKALGDDLNRYDSASVSARGHYLNRYDSDLAYEHRYRTTIANKAALIVLDDVWSVSDVKPLLAESPRSRFLFTTRDAAIGRFVGAREHQAELLDVAQSRELLASWANISVARLPLAADDIIHECGRLPLALSMVGAMLRGADTEFWKDTLDLLRNADLSAIDEQLPDGQDSFFKAVEVSFRSLKSEMQERYKALAVLLEDTATPLPILQIIWNASDVDARRTSRLLVDRSLARTDDAGQSIRLHDLQLDYVRAQHPDKGALSLIRGAVRLSSNALAKHAEEFASQMVGRLLPHRHMAAIARFTEEVIEGTRNAWLRPQQSSLNPSGTALIRVLQGHTDSVNAVALARDARLAVSASGDLTLKVWDIQSGRELHTLAGHTSWVNGVALTSDGRLAVSGSFDQTLKVWDVARGRELYTLAGHDGAVACVAMSLDGWVAISASTDHTLKVWDLESGRELRTLVGHSSAVNAVALSGDGRLAVSASADQTLKVWDVVVGRELRTLAGHTRGVTGVALSEDGQVAISASYDQTIKVWDVASGIELRNLGADYRETVYGIALSRDGRLAVCAADDYTLKVWEVRSGRELRTLGGHAGDIKGVTLCGDGRLAVSASEDTMLKVWEVQTGRELHSPARHARSVHGVAVTPNGERAISASADKTLKVWEVQTGRELRTLVGHTNGLSGVGLSADGTIAISSSSDETLRVWDVENGTALRTLAGHSGAVHCVALRPDGHLAVSGSEDYTLKVWDVDDGHILLSLSDKSASTQSVALSVDGRRAASASQHIVEVWDLASGNEIRTLKGHSSAVLSVGMSGDGHVAVSGSADGKLKVWELESEREPRTLDDHKGRVNGVALSEDGQLAASASDDNSVKVWKLNTGEVLATFTCDSAAQCCAFADDDKLIVAGDAGGHVHFLRLEEPKAKN